MRSVLALTPRDFYAEYISAASILISTDQNTVVSEVSGRAQPELPHVDTNPAANVYATPLVVGTTPLAMFYSGDLDWALFQSLVAQWHQERGVTSSVTQMATCKSYQCIVGMGDRAIPLIMSQLESEGRDPDHWFWALRAITAEDPVPKDAQGDMSRMAAAWLNWGRSNGYAW
jgi:hypothetical protein